MKLRPIGIKRVVLNPRAYLRPFTICVVAHHLPLLIAYVALDKPAGTAACARLADLFDWLVVAFVLHAVTAALMVLDTIITLCQPVYRLRRPERWLILLIFALYVTNLVWTMHGEASFRTDTSECASDSDAVQDRADSIAYFQHVDFVFTTVVVALGCCSSYLCGVHTSADLAEAELRWQRRCTTLFRACTCRRKMPSSTSSNGSSYTTAPLSSDADGHTNDGAASAQNDDEDIFQSLGKILGKFFVVRYNTTLFEGLAFNDLAFMLGLVAKSQKQERKEAREARDAAEADGHDDAAGTEQQQRLPAHDEERRLRDLAFFGKLAIGIYGWPIYVWYSPFYWFRVFGCFVKPSAPAEQVVDHDNALQGNRASFVGYTGIRRESLVYLNCYNFVFQAPYSIVKDATRRELIISVRGSMSFYDFVTDGLARVELMHPDELPLDVPNRFGTRTHYGMLRTARQLFGDLQVGSRKQLFWDFALRHCASATASARALDAAVEDDGTAAAAIAAATSGENDDDGGRDASGRTPWRIVVCGHSMGAGVGAILTVMLRKEFPATRAFLYAPPMMFDPRTAAWTKTFMTTAVYGDDIVPRLSIANVTRLRDEMATHFHEVAYEPLYRVRYGRLRKTKLQPPASSDSVELAVDYPAAGHGHDDTDVSVTAIESDGQGTITHHPDNDDNRLDTPDASQSSSTAAAAMPARSYRSFSDVAAALGLRLSSASVGGANNGSRREQRASRVLDLNFLRVSELDASQDVDVPGEIIHIETYKRARKCSCTMLLGEQQLTYTVRDASYFRRIWVTTRAVQDHMVHHYDRQIAHLVNNCLEFEQPAHGTSARTHRGRGRMASTAESSDPSASSWIDESTTDDDGSHAASSVTPYREIDELV